MKPIVVLIAVLVSFSAASEALTELKYAIEFETITKLWRRE